MKKFITTATLSFFTLVNIAEAQTDKTTLEASLLASLPTTDENVQTPMAFVNIEKLWASLPTIDENVEDPARSINVRKLMALLPTSDTNVEVPVWSSTNVESKNTLTVSRLSEE